MEFMKFKGKGLINQIIRIFWSCMEDWKNVSMYKGIGDKNKCANYTTISLLNVSENV